MPEEVVYIAIKRRDDGTEYFQCWCIEHAWLGPVRDTIEEAEADRVAYQAARLQLSMAL